MNEPKNKDGVCPLTGNPCPFHKQIHITENRADGSSRELNLCHACGAGYLASLEPPQAKPVEQPPEPVPVPVNHIPPSKADLMHEFIQFVLNPPQSLQPKKWKKSPCPQCGWTIEDIRRTAKLGCHACWQWFKNEMHLILKNAHAGGVRHVGKVPKAWKARQEAAKLEAEKKVDESLSPSDQIERLEEKMAKAIKEERYEDAAIIRDTIKTIQEKRNQTSG